MANGKLLENAAKQAAEQYASDRGVAAALDPGAILSWGQLLVEIFTRCQNKSGEELVASAKKPGLLQRLSVQRAVNRSEPRLPHRLVVQKADSLFAVAARSQPSDIEALQQEILESDL